MSEKTSLGYSPEDEGRKPGNNQNPESFLGRFADSALRHGPTGKFVGAKAQRPFSRFLGENPDIPNYQKDRVRAVGKEASKQAVDSHATNPQNRRRFLKGLAATAGMVAGKFGTGLYRKAERAITEIDRKNMVFNFKNDPEVPPYFSLEYPYRQDLLEINGQRFELSPIVLQSSVRVSLENLKRVLLGYVIRQKARKLWELELYVYKNIKPLHPPEAEKLEGNPLHILLKNSLPSKAKEAGALTSKAYLSDSIEGRDVSIQRAFHEAALALALMRKDGREGWFHEVKEYHTAKPGELSYAEAVALAAHFMADTDSVVGTSAWLKYRFFIFGKITPNIEYLKK